MIAGQIGPTRRLVVRHERVAIGRSARLLYASDLHLGLPWTRGIPGLIWNALIESRPDAVLLGGDLVEREHGLGDLGALVRRIAPVAPVAAVAGNHDVSVGGARVRETVREAGGHWLLDAELRVGDATIDGRVVSGSDARILCAHDPACWPRARTVGYALTLAGHLHGCQLRLASYRGREYPGAWLYRWNGPRFEQDQATLLVSRGVADTLPLRWNCPHDVLLVECF